MLLCSAAVDVGPLESSPVDGGLLQPGQTSYRAIGSTSCCEPDLQAMRFVEFTFSPYTALEISYTK
jgi:hypothetical protein